MNKSDKEISVRAFSALILQNQIMVDFCWAYVFVLVEHWSELRHRQSNYTIQVDKCALTSGCDYDTRHY
jgi:hypothetical protein